MSDPPTLLGISCPRCSASYRVATDHAGRRLKCRSCGEVLSIPAPDRGAAAPPPDRHRHGAGATPGAVARNGTNGSGHGLSAQARLPGPKAGSVRERIQSRRTTFQVRPVHVGIALGAVATVLAYLLLHR
jgi:predicted Zn finger-like uncharacterized protein